MFSNSRLTLEQKAERRAMLENLPAGSTLATDGVSLTILAVPDGGVTRVFSSVASPDEQKFRRKVGEFHALCRFYNDANGGLLLPGIWDAAEIVSLMGLKGIFDFTPDDMTLD